MTHERNVQALLCWLDPHVPEELQPQLESTVRKALRADSVVEDWEAFLALLEEPDPTGDYADRRTEKAFRYLLEATKNDDLVSTVCFLLEHTDPAF